MKKNIIDKYVTETSFISAFVVMIAMLILGVKNDYFYNYIITASVTGVSALITSIVFSLKICETQNTPIFKVVITSILCTVISFAVGYLFEFLILDRMLKINICAIEKMVAVLYKTSFAVFVTTILCHKVFSGFIKKN